MKSILALSIVLLTSLASPSQAARQASSSNRMVISELSITGVHTLSTEELQDITNSLTALEMRQDGRSNSISRVLSSRYPTSAIATIRANDQTKSTLARPSSREHSFISACIIPH